MILHALGIFVAEQGELKAAISEAFAVDGPAIAVVVANEICPLRGLSRHRHELAEFRYSLVLGPRKCT